MQMIPDLREAFHLDNLRRAWRWLNTNSDAIYKSYFRHIYRAYGVATDDNLADLHKRLIRGEFQPQHAIKLYLPKKSGIQRTYTLLTVEDQIVYQSLTNVIADRLLLKMRRRYDREVFGNQYAGQWSKYFYRDWRKGYRKFSDAVRTVYDRGFVYTASFDLTACYDSIDHSVLSYFLSDLGLQREFIDKLCEYLKLWTAALAEERIYQGHGIPQGPLSSGLLSEVVLRYFDENRTAKPRAWRYFRYVDDIRFFAKNEHNLRSMLAEMDLLSKQIGLFPQSSKIGIHRVTTIEEEIKSISHPPEPVAIRLSSNQLRIRQRLQELSPRHQVTNETRFKYVLGGAQPNATLSIRLLLVLAKQPHLYVSIFNYFDRYAQMSKKVSADVLELLKTNGLYAAFTAAGLRALRGHCHPDVQPQLEQFAKRIIDNSGALPNSELRATAVTILLASGRLKWQDILDFVTQEQDWWPRSEMIRYVQIEQVGQPSYQYLINQLLKDPSVDVSVVAADLMAAYSLGVSGTIEDINRVAQLVLKKMGFITMRRRGGPCPVSTAMQSMLDNTIGVIDWKQVLDTHYKHDISKAIRLRAYFETDATAWVNLLDTLHDDLLNSLFAHEGGALGTYQHGNIGGLLNSPTSAFHVKYPKASRAFKEIHERRLESWLSHSVTRATGKRTRFIEHNYLEKVRSRLSKGYLEIWRQW